ncbi:hypothetical protein [Glaciibacter superstes]|uniref:hypothetical protein n=1 Tax=Glaciibacter superstes TaxID=501023 RepID=UPI0003B71D49|nr:hypothetical protein [Glaciibacter superstes]
MGINLSGQVPGEQLNGLADMEEELLHERTPDQFLAVVVVERASRKYDDVKQITSAVVRFKHIEPLEGERAESARLLLEAAYAARTGEATLPLELDLDEPLEDEDNVTEGPWDDTPEDAA